MKIENQSPKQSHKLDGIGVGRIRGFPFLPILFTIPSQRRHKQNQCSASDSVGSIFTRSYRSTLLITTRTTTPSLVKTSLKEAALNGTNMVQIFCFMQKKALIMRMQMLANYAVLCCRILSDALLRE